MHFRYPTRKLPRAALQQLHRVVAADVLVAGTDRRGWFTGALEGEYELDGDHVRVVIRRKPRSVTWATVNEGLRQLVA